MIHSCIKLILRNNIPYFINHYTISLTFYHSSNTSLSFLHPFLMIPADAFVDHSSKTSPTTLTLFTALCKASLMVNIIHLAVTSGHHRHYQSTSPPLVSIVTSGRQSTISSTCSFFSADCHCHAATDF